MNAVFPRATNDEIRSKILARFGTLSHDRLAALANEALEEKADGISPGVQNPRSAKVSHAEILRLIQRGFCTSADFQREMQLSAARVSIRLIEMCELKLIKPDRDQRPFVYSKISQEAAE